MSLSQLRAEMLSLKNPAKAKILSGFFKTGIGEYGEGDEFFGITVPESRKIAKKYSNLTLEELSELIKSKVHEERLCAILILVEEYKNKKTSEEKRLAIKEFYLKNTKYINNWDLVDLSAHYILGEWLYRNPNEKKILASLAKSNDLWEKRISTISTFYFIRKESFEDTFKISKMLLADSHDLIHKAVGWMLREVGKRNLKSEEEFLLKYYKKMPRTMLRYAIEKFPEKKRQNYLKGKA